MVAILASLLLQSRLEFWFSDRARGMLENSVQLARTTYDNEVERVAQETVTASGDIAGYLHQVPIDDPQFGAAFAKLQVLIARLPEWTEAALRLEPAIAELAGRYRFMERAIVVGRGLNYANAFEFALKLMETCYVLADRFSTADFLHGPIAMIERSFPMFLFAPPGVTEPGIRDMLNRLESLKAETLVITSGVHLKQLRVAKIVIPARPAELFTPIPYIVPAQLFTAYLAEEKGLNPDRPRTLEKVTRTL